MTDYKNVLLNEDLHTRLKVRATLNKRSLIEELEKIVKEALEDETK